MIRLSLNRDVSTDQGTAGWLYHDGVLVCRTMELPWRDVDGDGNDDRMQSCIRPGIYQVSYMKRSASGKYLDVYHIEDVPCRSEILIHPANFAGDTKLGFRSDLLGCIAPCLRIGELKNPSGNMQMAGLSSRLAMNKIHAVTGRKSFELEVV